MEDNSPASGMNRQPPSALAVALMALGNRPFPARFDVDGLPFRFSHTLKHDFFAATGVYRSDNGQQVVLKVSRVADFFGIPMRWSGRFLWKRELQLYRKLQGIDGIPRVLGTVAPNGMILEYVQGRPLSEKPAIPDGFFDALFAMFREMHRREVAYVDANKSSNILLGDDGKPHVVDFQISQDLDRIGRWFPQRWLLKRLQSDDLYHLLKHKRRLRPDELTNEDQLRLQRASRLVRMHRLLARPYLNLRRRTFRRLRATGRLLPEGSK